MISFTTMSPACSSVRKMGRPTIEGNWCSGKFWRQTVESASVQSWFCREATYLGCIANLEETGSSIEHWELLA